MHQYQKGVDLCQYCERPMRPFKATAKEFPGTLYRASATCCGSCKNGLRKGTGPVTTGRFKAGMICKGCESPLRAFGSSLKANPGTKAHSKNGRCRTCAATEDFRLAVEESLATGKPLPVKPEDVNKQRLLYMPPRPANLDSKSGRHRDDLESYIARRRMRGIPIEGISVEEWTYKNGVAE